MTPGADWDTMEFSLPFAPWMMRRGVGPCPLARLMWAFIAQLFCIQSGSGHLTPLPSVEMTGVADASPCLSLAGRKDWLVLQAEDDPATVKSKQRHPGGRPG